MSDKQIASALAGLTGIATKVFEAVPINDWWGMTAIVAELKRTGSVYDFHKVSGCLNSMEEQGLVRRNSDGAWQRCAKASRLHLQMPPQAKEPAADSPASPAAPTETTAATRPCPMDTMLAVAGNMREAGRHLIAQAETLEAACLAQMEVESAYKAQMAHFEQLRTLLAAIGKSAPA